MNRAPVLVVLAASLAACGTTGIICSSNEVRCGQTCANLTSDPDHCGACGEACGTGFVCQNSLCVCPPSLNLTACGQSCVDLHASADHCGACGTACPAGQFCSDGGCGASCPLGSTACGGGCVDSTSDRSNCGGCADAGGVVCPQGQACTAGVCGSDLYAACFNSGEIYALDAQAELASATKATAPPANPAGLAFHGHDELAAVDGIAAELYSFDLTSGFGTPDTFAVGQGPNAVVISGDVAVVVNASDNSLDVLDAHGPGWARRCPPDAGGCTASVHFAANSSPEYAAFGTDAIYVSLLGNTQSSAPSGNALARVALADFSVQLADLSTLDLQAPDAGTQARPYGVAVANGQVFVALANLAGFTADGPGLVAVLDIVSDGGAPVPHGQPIALGDGCVNAGAVLLHDSTLYVACGPRYDPTTFAATQPGAIAALDIGTLAPAFPPQTLGCEADAGSCVPGGASRMAIAGGKLYVGDLVDGRLFIADPATGQLSRGPANPLNVCPAPDGGFNFIADVAARP